MLMEHKRKIQRREMFERLAREFAYCAIGSTLFASGILATLAYWLIFGY